MCKVLFIFISLFFHLHFFAQEFERTYQDSPMVYGTAIATSENKEIIVGTISGQFFGWGNFKPTVYKLDAYGDVIWSTDLPNDIVIGDVKLIYDIEVWNDEYYLLAGYEGCDYGVSNTLLKLNTAGETLWKVENIGDYWTPYLSILDNGLLAVLSKNLCELYSPDGVLILSYPLVLGATDAVSLSDRKILVIGIEGYQIIDIENLDNTENNTSIDSLLQVEILSSQELIFLNNKGLYKLDQNQNKIISDTFQVGTNFRNFVHNESKIYLYGQNPDTSSVVAVYCYDLDKQEEIKLAGKHVIPSDISIFENQINLTGILQDGTIYSHYYNHPAYLPFQALNSSLWIKSFSTDSSLESAQPDVGIVDITVNNLNIKDSIDCYFENSLIGDVIFEDVEVTIKNFGNQEINSLNVNSIFTLCPFICSSWSSYLVDYEDLNVAAGEELILSLGDIEVYGIQYDESGYEICFWTSCPDGKMDQTQANNQYCKFIDLSVMTKEPLTIDQIEIFPNPTIDHVEVVSSNNQLFIDEIFQIIDVRGKVIAEYRFTNTNSAEMDLTNVNSGIYFIKIKNSRNNQSVYKRIAKL